MKRILIVLVLVLLLAGCTAKPASADGEAVESSSAAMEASDSGGKASAAGTLKGEIKFYPTVDPEYKTGRNEMFDFWFDVPNEWKAEDRSEDGAEYTILTDNDRVEIKIGGIMIDGKEEEYYAKLAGYSGTIAEFTYRDGWIGKQISVSATEMWYVRVDGDSYMVLYINAAGQDEWMERNREKLGYVAASQRTTRESYGNSMGGENSVTFEDLQLGDIKLDMSYSELLLVIGQKPDREEVEEYEGVVAKTLFFADNTQIYVVNEAVYSINVTSPLYATPRGLKVGDGTDRVVELYGEPDSKENGNHWGYSYNGYEVFTVIIEDGKVTQMQIDMTM